MTAAPDAGVGLGLVLDCADPDRVARFWAAALGYEHVGTFGKYAMHPPPSNTTPALGRQHLGPADRQKIFACPDEAARLRARVRGAGRHAGMGQPQTRPSGWRKYSGPRNRSGEGQITVGRSGSLRRATGNRNLTRRGGGLAGARRHPGADRGADAAPPAAGVAVQPSLAGCREELGVGERTGQVPGGVSWPSVNAARLRASLRRPWRAWATRAHSRSSTARV
jgi:hypothetical protein